VAPTELYALNVHRCSAKPATQGEEERSTPSFDSFIFRSADSVRYRQL